ncbi:MAG: hypothetical protein J2P48_11665 [Alphaproteobacteria bacterium]|nr:hypothetical protein [Alphaproteobacteria bacterium]
MCSYTDIKDSRVDLCDLDVMNELLDVQRYNQERIVEHERRKQEDAVRRQNAWPMAGR